MLMFLVTGPAVAQVTGACCLGPDCVELGQDDCARENGQYLGDNTRCEPTSCDMLFVALDSFTADLTKRGVLLKWRTTTEIDNVGFRILREAVGRTEKSPQIIGPQLIPGRGENLLGADYKFLDNSRQAPGTVRYYLEDIDTWGRVTRHGPVQVEIPDPAGAGGSRKLPTKR